MVKESDDAIPLNDATNTVCIVIISQINMFQRDFLTTTHQLDADVSVKDHVLMTKEPCVILGLKALG